MRSWPIVGRERELGVVQAAFAGAAVNAVLMLGDAGLGKTRLAREALDRLDCRTEWIAASRAAHAIPFGALARILPEEVQAPGGPAGLIRAVCSEVASWGGRARVAIGVDDAHLLDDPSATVVASLVTAGAAFVVLTVRSSERLADCLARLTKDGDAEVLALLPLPDVAIDRLIDHSIGPGIEVSERRRLRAAAKGNPLALRELLHGAVPGGLTDLVAARLDGLDPGPRHVVEIVACGEPVPLEFLEAVAGPAAVAAAEHSRLVVGERSGARVQARLDHPLFGDVLRARMGLARTRQIYRELAAQLLNTGLRRREDGIRVALWQVEGGQVVRPNLVREGARQAIGRSGLALAERLARAAREAEPGVEADWLLAQILEYQGRSAEAAELLPASPPARLAERIRWAVARADWLYWGRGDLAAAGQVLDTAAGHPTVEGARAFHLFFAGHCADAVRVADGVREDPQGLVWAAAASTASLGFLGRLDESQSVRAHGVAVAAAHATSLLWARFQIEVAACLAHLACGRARDAEVIATAEYQRAVCDGTPMVIGWALYRGIVAATMGHLDRAQTLLAEAAAGLEHSDTFRLRRLGLAAQAWVHALRGEARPASELIAAADRLDNGSNEVFGPWLATWHAWAAYAEGDAETATAHATRAADLATAAGMPYVAAMAHYELVRLGGTADRSGLEPLPVLRDAARALGEGDGIGLTHAADTLADLGYHLHAAELAAAAVRVLRTNGQRGRAGLAAAAAADLRARCATARTPLLAPVELNKVLTTRERQVVLLAARYSSRQIAQRLDLALSTVNNTLARAYTKLDVTGRAQLRALLDPAGHPLRDESG
jgi:DNA-binding CsgD family transcriptional regulator